MRKPWNNLLLLLVPYLLISHLYTYHQRIAVPLHFIHSGMLLHVQFFSPTNPKLNLFHTGKKICCQVLPTPSEDAQNPVFIQVCGFSMILHNVCSSVRNASISGTFFMNFSLNVTTKHMFSFSVISSKNLLFPATVTIKSL